MAQFLDDNTVIPSYLDVRPQGDVSVDPGNMTNLGLRPGEVREIIYPDDKRNVNGRFIEYVVEIQEKDGNGPGTSTKYSNCILSNPFGSTADLLRYTLRADNVGDPETGIGKGSKVLVLCVNGQSARGVIIGGSRDTGTDTDGSGRQGKDSKQDGHNLLFEFNGIKGTINKDGELRIEYRGATNADGSLASGADSEASGSSIVFDKTGGIKVFTSAGGQLIHLDRAGKKIDMQAEKEWNVRSDDTIDMTAQGQVTVTGKTCSIDMDDRAFIRTAGLYVGTATDSTLLGSTYRQAQQTMHQSITPLLDSISTTIAAAASNLQVASALHKVPIYGAFLGSTNLQLAATSLNALGPMFNALSAAIKSFEGGASGYLSTKNKSD